MLSAYVGSFEGLRWWGVAVRQGIYWYSLRADVISAQTDTCGSEGVNRLRRLSALQNLRGLVCDQAIHLVGELLRDVITLFLAC